VSDLNFIIKKAAEILEKKGYCVIHPSEYKSDMEKDFLEIWDKVKNFTMISVERGYNVYKSVEYICKNSVAGDFAECGVWKGGACMIMAYSLLSFGKRGKKIIMYDTFEGMPEPSKEDCIAWTGENMKKRWQKNIKTNGEALWSADIDEVEKNIFSTGYPKELIELVKGDIVVTLDKKTPKELSILRLDTDWYKSTKKELEILYPLLNRKGVLIIDDYGHFTGAKKAVDEYFAEKNRIFLSRIDYTGRVGVKL
jgi:hypothetical protein